MPDAISALFFSSSFFFCFVGLSSISLKQERGSAEHTSKSAYYGQGGCGLPLAGSMPGSRNQTAIGLLTACPNRTSSKLCKVKCWEWTNSNPTFIQHCFSHAMYTPTDLAAGNWDKWGPSWAWACKSLWCVVIRTHSSLHWLSKCPFWTRVTIYLNSAVRQENTLTWNHRNIQQQQPGKFWLIAIHFSS